MATLADIYRPKTWDTVIGQEKAIGKLKRLQKAGRLSGRGYWIVGASGIGKTTIAEIIASEVADEMNILRLRVAEITPAMLRTLEYNMRMVAMGKKKGKAIIINEAHGLRKDAIRAFKDVLENLPDNVVILFTTTRQEEGNLFDDGNTEDAGPFRDRCTVVNLTNQGLAKPFAVRAQEIAIAEGLDGKPIGSFVMLLKNCKNSMRGALSRIDDGIMVD